MEPAADAGMPVAPLPPFPEAPQVVSSGGPVVAAPHVVPVFFSGDELQPKLEELLGTLATSTYWSAVTAEYGVGALTVGASIVSTDMPPATDDALQAWLAAQPGAGPSTLFAVYYPSTASLTIHGKKSCEQFDGYHHDAKTTAGGAFPFAVIMRCESGPSALDAVTKSTSHELVEAATDPFYYTKPAFASADRDHAAWTLATVGEVGDMCELESQDGVRLGGFLVQRSWSNTAAAAGHDPCLPALAEPYFAAAPIMVEDVPVDDGLGSTTKGIKVPVGESRTVDIALHSDGKTAAWRVDAKDSSAIFGGDKELELTLDRKTGVSGDVLHLTIKALRAGAYGGSVLVLQSTLGTTSHVSFGFVAN